MAERTENQDPLLLQDSAHVDQVVGGATAKLDVQDANQSAVKLDALGPMVVNSDGTLSRIANWDKLSELEKERTLRVLNARNKRRLMQQAAEEGAASAEAVSSLKDSDA